MTSPTDFFVSLPGGRIHGITQGEGPVLLLMHSNGCSVHEYDAALPWLARHYRCIAFDMPGHGDSDPPPGHLSIEDHARTVVALMDALGIAQAHVCGASVGGFITIALAGQHACRLLTATVVEAALRTAQEWADQWPRIEASFATVQQGTQEVAPRVRELTPTLLARWNIDRAKAGAWRMVDVMWAIREYDALAALAAVKAPCAIVIGERGPVVAGRARYAQALPQAPVRLLADCGHFPMIDAPQAFAQAVHDGITALADKR